MDTIYAIGDIHGCLDKLEDLLTRIPMDWRRDRMVFMGDYVDRGPDSRGVIELLLDLNRRHGDRIVFLKGNHEWMFMQYLFGEDSGPFLLTGGRQTLDSYTPTGGTTPEIPSSHRDFLAHLSLYYETDAYIFVHAGLRPGLPLSRQESEDFLWIRSPFLSSDYNWGKRIVFGHTPFSVPLIQPNKIGIDTGAVYGGRLTALKLPDVDFIFS